MNENNRGKRKPAGTKVEYKGVKDYLKQVPLQLKKLWDEIDAYLLGLGDDVQKKHLKNYVVYRKLKNFPV